MKISELKIDAAKVEAGAWVKDIPGFDGVAVRVRGTGSHIARDTRAKATAAIPAARQRTGLSAEDQDSVSAVVARDALLIDIRGMTGDDDAPMTVDQVKGLLPDPDYAALVGLVYYAASIVEKDGVETLEADLGN